METAGKTLDEKELSDAMKETGLGTPATRAAIIEVLLKRGYIIRNGKSLEATGKGIRLIEIVHPEVKSPAMTGQWEAYLTRIQRGKAQLEPFLRGIEDYVREVVGKVGSVQPPTKPSIVAPAGQAQTTDALPEPSSRPVLEAGDTLTSSAPSCVWLLFFPAESGSGLPGGCRWERRAARHADRIGQVAVLPVTRNRAGWNDAGDQPADRVDGRPGRKTQGTGFRR
jgi:DNA topoisomerase-3